MRPLATALLCWMLLLLLPGLCSAEAQMGPVGVAGYLRVMTRPDFQGGGGTLGYWNLYGRLLNEGPWFSLETKIDVLARKPGKSLPWTSLHARLEGGSVFGADAGQGSLAVFRLSQLYAEAGNVLGEGVTWRLGTLDTWFGDLGLYDMRPAELFNGTLGVSAHLEGPKGDVLLGIGDAGWSLRGGAYNTVLVAGGTARAHLSEHVELGIGGTLRFEPAAQGSRNAPYTTPGMDYEDFLRGEVVKNYVDEHPSGDFDSLQPSARNVVSGKAVAYLGFGGVGPLRWNSLYAHIERHHPLGPVTESWQGREHTLYITDLTDQRYDVQVGNELLLELLPQRFDLAWGLLAGWHWDEDNTLAPSDNDRSYLSTVLRTKTYLTPTLHLLVESSVAREYSPQGTVYRNHVDSIFQGAGGKADARGLEFGDADTRITWQGKAGFVLSPLGAGLYLRPALRLLYGVQYSTQNNAFGNAFVESLFQDNIFGNKERHWHHVVALEAEAWF